MNVLIITCIHFRVNSYILIIIIMSNIILIMMDQYHIPVIVVSLYITKDYK